MDIHKPVINIYYYNCDYKILDEISAGIEEEGLLYEVKEEVVDDLLRISKRAAENSILGVGLGVVAKDVFLYIDKLHNNNPLFKITAMDGSNQYRKIGANAARYIKGLPFKLE